MKLLLSLFFLFATHLFQAQNLIPNPSFEDTSSMGCPLPSIVGNVDFCKYWYEVHGTSTDYYNVCAGNNGMGVPTNMAGHQYPHLGNAYCGLIPNTNINPDYEWNEYLGVKIKYPLVIGKIYEFQMFLSLSDKSGHTTDDFGVLFSKSKLDTFQSYSPPFYLVIQRVPQIKNTNGNYIIERNGWQKFTQRFIADSTYKYLLIGDFLDHIHSDEYDTGFPSGFISSSGGDFPYFYIDDASLTPVNSVCLGDSITLYAPNDSCSHAWANSNNPSVILSTDSAFTVSPTTNSVYYEYSNTDTIRYIVDVFGTGVNYLGNDTNLCIGETLQLNAISSNSSYLWQDGSTDYTYAVKQPGTYWVQITNTCGTFTDSIKVTYNSIPVNLGNDTVLCANSQSITLDPHIDGASYLWQDLETTSETFYIGQYYHGHSLFWVRVSDSLGCGRDSINITHFSSSNGNFLGNDTTVCEGDTVPIHATTPYSTYLWNTGSTDSVLYVTHSGNYSVHVSNFCFTDDDSKQVHFKKTPYFDLGSDTTLCEGDSLHLKIDNSQYPFAWIQWEDNKVSSVKTIYDPGVYFATANLQGCHFSDTIHVNFESCSFDVNAPNIITPNGDGINDVFSIQVSLPCKGNITIVNRWGNLIYSKDFESDTVGKVNLWDGKSQGKLVTEGTYFYLIDLASQNGKPNKLKGFVEVSN